MANKGGKEAYSRSANAPIKGYMYQFDKTILELISALDDEIIIIEGAEDIDRTRPGVYEAVQCKYLEAQTFSLPRIRDAVAAMLVDSVKNDTRRYQLYIHSGDLSKFRASLDLEALKECLTKKPTNKPPVYLFAEYSDAQLTSFADRLTITPGESYDRQMEQVTSVLMAEFSCAAEDCRDLFYPKALAVVCATAIKTSESNRRISKKDFINEVNKRLLMYTRWHAEQVGLDRFVSALTRRIKAARAIDPTTERLLVIDGIPLTSLQDAITIAVRLGRNSYKPGSLRTATPWTVVFYGDDTQVVNLKRALLSDGIIINDGFEHILFQADHFNNSPIINTKKRSCVVSQASYTLRIISYKTYVGQQNYLLKANSVFSVGDKTIPGSEDRTFYLTSLPVERILEVLGV
jgi:hypothetical protein